MLSELEKDLLQIILNNEVLLKTLKKVFHIGAEQSKPIVLNEDDMIIGQKYRAYDTAKKIIEQSFIKMEEARKSPVDNISTRHK